MARADLAGLILTTPHNVHYLSGMDTENLFDYQVLLLPASSPPLLIISEFERACWEASAYVAEVRTYGPSADPIDATTQAIEECLPSGARIGFDRSGGDSLPEGWVDRLSSALPRADFCPSHGLVEKVRLVKSEPELAYMRQAAGYTDIGVRAALQAARAGDVDCEIAGRIMHALYTAGSRTVCWGPIVAAGYRAGVAHSTFNGYRVRAGDSIFFELTGEAARYTSPLMRTAVAGHPSSEMMQTAEAVQNAIAAIVKVARPGVAASDVAGRALRELDPVLDGKIFHYNFGYPVGIGYPSSWIERLNFFIQIGNDERLQSNMVFHLPMSVRKYGEWGINLSQTIVIGDDVTEVLSRTPAEIVVLEA